MTPDHYEPASSPVPVTALAWSRRMRCRELAWMGAEAVLQVSLTTTSDRPQELVLARANAIFNQLYVVSVNAGSPAGLVGA